MTRFPIPRPTEATAIGRVGSLPPAAPHGVLLDRMAAAYASRDRHGLRLLDHQLRRCTA